MFNDDGLGQAMSESYNRKLAEGANEKTDKIVLAIKELVAACDFFSSAIEDLDKRVRALEGK